ncbi:MAG: hypothetical protein ACRCT1_15395 [Microcoleaceae cyanobacterium]
MNYETWFLSKSSGYVTTQPNQQFFLKSVGLSRQIYPMICICDNSTQPTDFPQVGWVEPTNLSDDLHL